MAIFVLRELPDETTDGKKIERYRPTMPYPARFFVTNALFYRFCEFRMPYFTSFESFQCLILHVTGCNKLVQNPS